MTWTLEGLFELRTVGDLLKKLEFDYDRLRHSSVDTYITFDFSSLLSTCSIGNILGRQMKRGVRKKSNRRCCCRCVHLLRMDSSTSRLRPLATEA